MLIIGLTGGIGSGKTEVTNIFSSLGAHIIDTDTISHQLTEAESPVLEKIIDHFGQNYLLSNKQLDRNLLSKTIFESAEDKLILENILHPEIKKSVAQKIADLTDVSYVIIVVPLLVETTFKNIVDKILVVDTTEDNQINRVQKRDNRNRLDIEKIIKQQTPRQKRLQYADDVILNTGSLSSLRSAVESLHNKYLMLGEQ